MSPESTRILGPEALEFATGAPPITQLTGNVEHVTWLGPGEGRADLYLIAPATANTISKIAHGIDDTAVTSFASVALGGGVPMVLAPAMHADMGRNPAIRENLARLRRWGVAVVEPTATEGEEKLASPEEVAHAVLRILARGPWAGRTVTVIGGAGREPIDSIRSITNESSGRMAVELATAASRRGAKVHLWAGALQVPVPIGAHLERWRSSADLLRLIDRQRQVLRASSLVLVPAALPDFSTTPVRGKISSRDRTSLTVRLDPAPRILPRLRSRVRPPGLLVGFKLESGVRRAELAERALAMAKEYDLDAVVANDAATMGSKDTDAQLLLGDGGSTPLRGSKEAVASELLELLSRLLADDTRQPSRSSNPRRRTARSS